MKDMNTRSARAEAGFTLIEIAIVLVIIGLLLGGVLQGQQLIENSRVRNATNEFSGIAAAAFSYQDRYGRLPGDDGPLATLTSRGGSWGAVTAAGNVNGAIDVTRANTFLDNPEGVGFFQHLRAAGFISGNPADSTAAAFPQNPFGGLIGITSDPAVADNGTNALQGTKICMSNVPGASGLALDTQLDDGMPGTGRFRATPGSGNAAPAATVVITDVYSEDDVYTICYRI